MSSIVVLKCRIVLCDNFLSFLVFWCTKHASSSCANTRDKCTWCQQESHPLITRTPDNSRIEPVPLLISLEGLSYRDSTVLPDNALPQRRVISSRVQFKVI